MNDKVTTETEHQAANYFWKQSLFVGEWITMAIPSVLILSLLLKKLCALELL